MAVALSDPQSLAVGADKDGSLAARVTFVNRSLHQMAKLRFEFQNRGRIDSKHAIFEKWLDMFERTYPGPRA